MKNRTLFVGCAGAIALLAMMVTACTSDTLDTPDTPTDKNERLITVEAGAVLRTDKPQTRLGYEDNSDGTVTVKWTYSEDENKNDKFTVFQEKAKRVFSLNGEPTEDGQMGSFSGQLAELDTVQTLYALYPSSAVSDAATSSSVVLDIASQKGTSLSEKDYMIAETEWNSATPTVNFGSFRHVMAMLRIKTEVPTSSEVDKVVITGLRNKQTLNPSDGGSWESYVEGDIILSDIDIVQPDGAQTHTFYLMVFPGSMKELKIVIHLKDGGTYTKTFTSDKSIYLYAENIYTINFGNPPSLPGGSGSEYMGGGGNTGDITSDSGTGGGGPDGNEDENPLV